MSGSLGWLNGSFVKYFHGMCYDTEFFKSTLYFKNQDAAVYRPQVAPFSSILKKVRPHRNETPSSNSRLWRVKWQSNGSVYWRWLDDHVDQMGSCHCSGRPLCVSIKTQQKEREGPFGLGFGRKCFAAASIQSVISVYIVLEWKPFPKLRDFVILYAIYIKKQKHLPEGHILHI